MANPVELSKFGIVARFRRLGSFRYILIAGCILLVICFIEIVRYIQYSDCVSEKSVSNVAQILADHPDAKQIQNPNLPEDLLFLGRMQSAGWGLLARSSAV
jgi:hypothetical protein